MGKTAKVGLAFFLFFLTHSCNYDNKEDLVVKDSCSTKNMSYSQDVLPLLTDYGCIGCHGDFSAKDLNSYVDVKIAADDGSLIGSIAHNNGFEPMPQNAPMMDTCDIAKIKAWIDQGALNN